MIVVQWTHTLTVAAILFIVNILRGEKMGEMSVLEEKKIFFLIKLKLLNYYYK